VQSAKPAAGWLDASGEVLTPQVPPNAGLVGGPWPVPTPVGGAHRSPSVVVWCAGGVMPAIAHIRRVRYSRSC
ncbi:MAG: hypothetical protein QOJ66_1301, partial [Ilumatobacteraceae bacterium]